MNDKKKNTRIERMSTDGGKFHLLSENSSNHFLLCWWKCFMLGPSYATLPDVSIILIQLARDQYAITQWKVAVIWNKSNC